MTEKNEVSPPLAATNANTISERKLQSNRENAQHSTGPSTKSGKNRSRLNAIKHGFYVSDLPPQRSVFPEDFNKARILFQELVDHYQPVGPMEKMLVEIIAECCWKVRRLQIAENASIKVNIEYEDKHFQINEGEKEDPYLFRAILYEKAEKSIEALGYVEDVLLKNIQQTSMVEGFFVTDVSVANEKLQKLMTEHGDGANVSGARAIKRARSNLLRSVGALRHRTLETIILFQRFENEQRKPYYARHLLPSPNILDNLLRYQAAVERRFYRSTAELERLQGQRFIDAGPRSPQQLMIL
jgi:hypothetical protein